MDMRLFWTVLCLVLTVGCGFQSGRGEEKGTVKTGEEKTVGKETETEDITDDNPEDKNVIGKDVPDTKKQTAGERITVRAPQGILLQWDGRRIKEQADGEYVIPESSPGTHRIRMESGLFEPLESRLTVDEGQMFYDLMQLKEIGHFTWKKTYRKEAETWVRQIMPKLFEAAKLQKKPEDCRKLFAPGTSDERIGQSMLQFREMVDFEDPFRNKKRFLSATLGDDAQPFGDDGAEISVALRWTYSIDVDGFQPEPEEGDLHLIYRRIQGKPVLTEITGY